MDLEQIKKLIGILEEHKLTKFTLKEGDFELHLEKGGVVMQPMMAESAPSSVEHRVVPPPTVEGQYVTSPMVGTYYGTPAPDQPPFVKVGDTVHENTVVCIVEAMKVMNEVKAGKSGVVVEIYPHSGQPLEFGAKILRIR